MFTTGAVFFARCDYDDMSCSGIYVWIYKAISQYN